MNFLFTFNLRITLKPVDEGHKIKTIISLVTTLSSRGSNRLNLILVLRFIVEMKKRVGGVLREVMNSWDDRVQLFRRIFAVYQPLVIFTFTLSFALYRKFIKSKNDQLLRFFNLYHVINLNRHYKDKKSPNIF